MLLDRIADGLLYIWQELLPATSVMLIVLFLLVALLLEMRTRRIAYRAMALTDDKSYPVELVKAAERMVLRIERESEKGAVPLGVRKKMKRAFIETYVFGPAKPPINSSICIARK